MSDSRARFEEWAKAQRMPLDLWEDYLYTETKAAFAGWSARDSEVERLREALTQIAAGLNADPRSVVIARAALSPQDKESA